MALSQNNFFYLSFFYFSSEEWGERGELGERGERGERGGEASYKSSSITVFGRGLLDCAAFWDAIFWDTASLIGSKEDSAFLDPAFLDAVFLDAVFWDTASLFESKSALWEG